MKNHYLLILISYIYVSICYSAPVPDTGINNCYDMDGNAISCPTPSQHLYGQDGNYNINSQSFTKLDAQGNAVSENASSWAMIRDNITGLIWENKTDDGSIHDKDNTYTWYDSNPSTNGGYAGKSGSTSNTENFINALNENKFGGFSDWRLPTIKELSFIINYSCPYNDIMIDPWYFSNISSANYWWSSTTTSNDNYSAMSVDINTGKIVSSSKYYYSYARAVRGEKLVQDLTDNGNGTITDNSTGLMWQQNISAEPMTWDNALAYCENLSLGGYTDWRMPNIKELMSIVDYGNYKPAIELHYFPNAPSSNFWSSSSVQYSSNSAYTINFLSGLFSVYSKKNASNVYIRAVRGGQAAYLTTCTSTLNNDLLLHIPYIKYYNPFIGDLTLWADFVYEYNQSTIPFKLVNSGIINSPSYSCQASTLNSDFSIHIPDVIFPDGSTHLWIDLQYDQTLSTDGNPIWIVNNYGSVNY